MTGICGFSSLKAELDCTDFCRQMRQALRMFGPHGADQWDGGQISLGIQKYRILPEDIYDTQPLSDNRFCMVADLRLDNRPELAADFGWSEADAARRADADFAFAAWKKWGEESFDKLIGDWALAVWDKQQKTLTLARDVLGQRPLFWYKGTNEAGAPFFAFASMTHGLFALPAVHMAPNEDFLKFYIALAPMRGEDWFFKDIHRVQPGGVTRLKADGTVDSRKWYDWGRIKEMPVGNDAECIRKFRSLFDRAVGDRLRTTSGVASDLSAGFDSSAVTTTAAKLLAHEGKRLAAYTHVPHRGWRTYAAPDRLADEGPVAAVTAATCPNIDHHLVDSGELEIGSDLQNIFYYAQTPEIHLVNSLWPKEIARLAAKNGAGVLLNGGMGNRIISKTGTDKPYEDFRHGRLLTWWRDLWTMKAYGFTIRSTLYHTFGPWLPPLMINFLRKLWHRPQFTATRYSCIRPEITHAKAFRRAIKARGFYPENPLHQGTTIFRPPYLDVAGVYQKAQLARTGLDSRAPASDRRLMEFSLSLPPRMWLRDGVTKWLYRQAFQGQVPEAVLNLPQKGQQASDWPERLRRGWPALKMEATAALEDPMVQKLIDTDFCQKILTADFPTKIDQDIFRRYPLKFLRGLTAAHFIRQANQRN